MANEIPSQNQPPVQPVQQPAQPQQPLAAPAQQYSAPSAPMQPQSATPMPLAPSAFAPAQAQPAPAQIQPAVTIQQQPVQQIPVQQMQPNQAQTAAPASQPTAPVYAAPAPQPAAQFVAPAPQPAAAMQPAPQPAAMQRPGMQNLPPRIQQPMPVKPGQVRPGAPLATRKPPNPKRLIYGCGGCAGAAILFFIIFVLIYVAQTSSTGDNPMARSLGVDPATFINTLILLVNVVFGSVSVILFLLAIVGFFRFFMARKDDKDARKRGITMAGATGLLLVLFVGIWVGIYLFLSGKQVRGPKAATVTGIVTEPANTLLLTAPITIKFDASKLPYDTKKYDILSYLWSFGDGQTSTVAITSHPYNDMGANSGQYDVTLQVKKRDKTTKEETTDTYPITVTIANVQINPAFTVTPASGPAPLEVTFDAGTAKAPAGEIASYEWDFDNNNVFTDASGVTATHTFDQIGKYKVNLRVTDNTGQFAIGTQEVEVTTSNAPVAVIDIPTQTGKYFAGTQYTFDAGKSASPVGKIEKYEWDFGDGTAKANTRTATHTYKTAGDYEVLLTVTDDQKQTGDTSQKIKVETQESAPIAIIATVPAPEKGKSSINGTVPFEVAFDGSKSTDPDNNIVDYKWDFDGDGTDDASGPKATYAYKTEGTFNATLTVIDAENNISKASVVVVVGAQPLQARITADPVEGVVPLTVTFDASSSSYPDGKIVSYEWDFGDGSPKRIDVSKVVYKYTKIGTFTAKVTAIASDGKKNTAETPINIRPVALTACYEASAETGAAPLIVEFDPRCSTGTIAKYSWDFGDGQTSRTRKPSHSFDKPGSYEVTLEVADNQNVIDTFSKTILVTGTI